MVACQLESEEKEEDDGMVTLDVTIDEQLLRLIDSSEAGFHSVTTQREAGAPVSD